MKYLFVCILVLIASLSFADCQWGSNNFGNSYFGGSGTNFGTYTAPFNNFAQNTQAYSNQISATSFTPYASYGSSFTGPWSTGFGTNSYSFPFFGGWGGYGGLGCGIGGWGGFGGFPGAWGGIGYGAGFGGLGGFGAFC